MEPDQLYRIADTYKTLIRAALLQSEFDTTNAFEFQKFLRKAPNFPAKRQENLTDELLLKVCRDDKLLVKLISGAREPPQFLKKSSENAGANIIFHVGFPSIPGMAAGVAPRIVLFVLLKS